MLGWKVIVSVIGAAHAKANSILACLGRAMTPKLSGVVAHADVPSITVFIERLGGH